MQNEKILRDQNIVTVLIFDQKIQIFPSKKMQKIREKCWFIMSK
jgi:hypothetical protein